MLRRAKTVPPGFNLLQKGGFVITFAGVNQHVLQFEVKVGHGVPCAHQQVVQRLGNGAQGIAVSRSELALPRSKHVTVTNDNYAVTHYRPHPFLFWFAFVCFVFPSLFFFLFFSFFPFSLSLSLSLSIFSVSVSASACQWLTTESLVSDLMKKKKSERKKSNWFFNRFYFCRLSRK